MERETLKSIIVYPIPFVLPPEKQVVASRKEPNKGKKGLIIMLRVKPSLECLSPARDLAKNVHV